MTDPATRQLLLTAAGLLEMGRAVDALSRPLTVLAFAGLLAPLAVVVPVGSMAALAAAALAGAAAAYAGARVAFDAGLFRGLAADADLPSMDRALLHLGLMPPSKAGRPLPERLAGAKGLLMRQAGLLAVQACALLAAGVAGLLAH